MREILLLINLSQLYEECAKISEALPPIEGLRHLACAKHSLSTILENLGRHKESVQYFEEAHALKGEILKGETGDSDTEPGFEGLVPWMLW